MAENEMDEYEVQQGLAQLDKFEKLARIKAQQAAMRNQQKVTDKAFKKALAKVGLDERQWANLINENPEAVQESFKQHVKAYVKDVAGSRGRRAEPKGRLAEPMRGRPSQPRRGSNYDDLKEKVSRGHAPSDDELIEHLTSLLR